MAIVRCTVPGREVPNVLQVLDPEGNLVGDIPAELGEQQLLEMLRWMVYGRILDGKVIALQRRGRLGTYAGFAGQEACQVGSALALDRGTDWVVPQYREQLVMLIHGLPLVTYLLHRMNHPDGYITPEDVLIWPQQVSLAAQLPHAVGMAWGLKLRREPGMVATYFGDGAASEGDFHESVNFAGVLKAPVVFFCQNNGWAISTPVHKQSAASSIADRAVGYGIQGVQVDGNDPLAVYAVVRDARARALAGEGPTLVEAMTYRMGHHTTADDSTRYVPDDELQKWRAKDPILRLAAHLRRAGTWSDADDEACRAQAAADIDAAADAALRYPPAPAGRMLDHGYANPPPAYVAQREQLGAP